MLEEIASFFELRRESFMNRWNFLVAESQLKCVEEKIKKIISCLMNLTMELELQNAGIYVHRCYVTKTNL